MKIITRYLLKELLVSFVIGVLFFTGILLFEQLFELTDLVVNKGLGLFNVIYVMLLAIPETFSLSVPMAFVLATILVYGRLAGDNELTILRASGVPLYHLVIPTLIVSLLISIGLLTIKQWGLPEFALKRKQALNSFKNTTNPVGLMQPRTYLTLGPITIYAEEIEGKLMRNVYLEDRRETPMKVITAKKGRWIKGKNGRFTLKLFEGSLHQTGDGYQYSVLDFSSQSITLNLKAPDSSTDIKPSPSLYDRYRALTKSYKRYKEALDKGQDDNQLKSLRKKTRKDQIQFHRNLAFSFATLFLLLVSAPLGMMSKKSGKSIGFVFSLGVIFIYYLMISFAEPIAMNGLAPPWLAMWAANIIFGLVGMGLMIRFAMKN